MMCSGTPQRGAEGAERRRERGSKAARTELVGSLWMQSAASTALALAKAAAPIQFISLVLHSTLRLLMRFSFSTIQVVPPSDNLYLIRLSCLQ